MGIPDGDVVLCTKSGVYGLTGATKRPLPERSLGAGGGGEKPEVFLAGGIVYAFVGLAHDFTEELPGDLALSGD